MIFDGAGFILLGESKFFTLSKPFSSSAKWGNHMYVIGLLGRLNEMFVKHLVECQQFSNYNKY